MPSQKYMKVPELPVPSGMTTSEGGGSVGVGGISGSSSTGIPSTDSSQQLIVDNDSTIRSNSRQYEGNHSVTYTEWFAMFVLCFVNLINYMDRFTIAGKFYISTLLVKQIV